VRTFVFLLLFTFLPNAQAQTSIAVEQHAAATTTANADCLIPARTPVLFTLDSAVSSKTSVPGNQFQLKVAEDIKVCGRIVIPQGTPATGEVIHAQKAAGLGKQGELILTIRYIDLNGQKIKMRSFQPLQGKSNSNAVLATSFVPVVGLFAGFIHGGQIEIPENTIVQALIAADSIVSLPHAADATESTELPQHPATPTTGDSQ